RRRTGCGSSSTGTTRAGRRSPPTRRPPASCSRPANSGGRPWASTSGPSTPRSQRARLPAGTRDDLPPRSRSSLLGTREPDRDLAGGGRRGVGAVHEVLLHLLAPVAAEVAADRAGGGHRRVGGAGQ